VYAKAWLKKKRPSLTRWKKGPIYRYLLNAPFGIGYRKLKRLPSSFYIPSSSCGPASEERSKHHLSEGVSLQKEESTSDW